MKLKNVNPDVAGCGVAGVEYAPDDNGIFDVKDEHAPALIDGLGFLPLSDDEIAALTATKPAKGKKTAA